MRDLDDPGTFRCPNCIKAGAELGVGVSDEETWRDSLICAPHQGVAGLLRNPCQVRGIGQGAAVDVAAAKMDEDQHISCPWSAKRQHSLGEEIAGDHGFQMRPDERDPGQSGLLCASLRAWVDARLVQDAFEGIGTGIKPQIFQLARVALVAPEKVFGSDANDDIPQLLRQARPSESLERGPSTHLGQPALISRGLGDVQKPVNIMPAFSPDAQEFSFPSQRQDNTLRRDAGPQDHDLGLQQPQVRVVSRHEELVQEDQKGGECRFHLAGLPHCL